MRGAAPSNLQPARVMAAAACALVARSKREIVQRMRRVKRYKKCKGEVVGNVEKDGKGEKVIRCKRVKRVNRCKGEVVERGERGEKVKGLKGEKVKK